MTGPEGDCIGTTGVLVNKQGLKLRTRYWPGAKKSTSPEIVLIFVHGHAAYLDFELMNVNEKGSKPSYADSWVERMNAQGITVCGIDNQGCGESEALNDLRFYVESFDDYVDDVLLYAESVENIAREKKAKLFIAGMSLGGCIAVNCVLRKRNMFDGMILLAPMLSLERVTRQGYNRYIRHFGEFFSWLFPTLEIISTDKNTIHPEIQEIWDADPLVAHGNTRVRNAMEYIRATEYTMSKIHSIDCPFLVLHSELDTMCDPDASKLLYKTSQSKDKTLRLVNSMWHVLVKEPGNLQILEEIIEWILKRS